MILSDRVFVLLCSLGYSHDDVTIIGVYKSKEDAEKQYTLQQLEPGNCQIIEAKVQ